MNPEEHKQILTLKTLLNRAVVRVNKGIKNIEGHTTSGSIADNTGCPLDFEEEAALLIELQTLLTRAESIADGAWDGICDRVRNGGKK